MYIGQTSRKFSTRMHEHKTAIEKQQWAHSGIAAHKRFCKEPVDWENPRILDTLQGKNKQWLRYNLRLRESIHIAKEKTGPGHGLNEDRGSYTRSSSWLPVFKTMHWCSWWWGGGRASALVCSTPPLYHSCPELTCFPIIDLNPSLFLPPPCQLLSPL